MIVILIIGLVLADSVCSLPFPPTALSKDLISSVNTVYGNRFITLNNRNSKTWAQRFFQIFRLIKNTHTISMEFQEIVKSTYYRRHIHKRFAPSYPQYCHFKICNMGKGSRYFRTIDKKFKRT